MILVNRIYLNLIQKSSFKYIRLLFFIFFVVFFYQPLFSKPIVLNSKIEKINITSLVHLYEDKTGKLVINDFLKPNNFQFLKNKKSSLEIGFTPSVYWLKFDTINKTNNNICYLEIADPLIDHISFFSVEYVKNSSGKITYSIDKKILTGDKLSFNSREIFYRNFVFKLNEKYNSSHLYFIRVESKGTLNFSLNVFTKKSFLQFIGTEKILLGFYLGAIIVMLLYNLFLFLSIKDKSYLYYILYYFSFLSFQLALNGIGFQYLWPNNFWWQNISLLFFTFLSIAFAITFARSFLEIPKRFPEMDKKFKILFYLALFFLPFSFLNFYSIVAIVALVLILLTSLLVLYFFIRNGVGFFRPAKFYLLAWGFLWIGSILIVLRIFAVIPDNLLTRWGQQGASLLEVVLISFGLADRINFMQRKLEDLNINLEKNVDERTKQLNDSFEKIKDRDLEFHRELILARDIQLGILPTTPFFYEGIKIEAYYKSMSEVGGDFFDIFHMSGGYLGVLIADASGHGMPAAFITALAKISFFEAAQKNIFPSEIFKVVNDELFDIIKTDDFLTAFFLVISPNFEVFYGNASHQLAIVLRKKDKSIEQWDTNGLFLGAMDVANEMYEDKNSVLNYGDRILLFTDGIVEARNSQDEIFGNDRLIDLVMKTGDLPLNEAKDIVLSEWQNFIGDTPLIDDITLLFLEIDIEYKDLITFREKGFRFLNEGDLKTAETFFHKSLKIDPNDQKSHLYLGESYLKDKNYHGSIYHLKKYLQHNEIDANVSFHMAQAYFNLEEYEKAYDIAMKSLQLRSESTDILIIAGLSLRELSREDEALAIWKRILEIEPENALAKFEMEKEL